MSATDEINAFETLRTAAGNLDTRVRKLARDRPVAAVVGMLLVGFVTARLLSARRK